MDVWIPTHNMEAFSCTDHATLHAQVLLFTLYSFMWGVCVLHAQWCCTLAVSLTCPVRLYVWSLSYTPCAICWWYFLWQLHTLCYIMWGVCLTISPLFYVGSVSYPPRAITLRREFVLHTLGYFMWKYCLTHPILFCCFSYTPSSIYVGSFLHAPCCFMWGASLTCLMLFYVGIFSYRPHGVLCGEFLLHAPCWFLWELSITDPMLFYVGSFSSTPHAVLYRELLFYDPCSFVWVVSLTRPCCSLCCFMW